MVGSEFSILMNLWTAQAAIGPIDTKYHWMPLPMLVVADHVHPIKATIYPSSNGYFQQDNAPSHEAKVILNWFHEHENEFIVLQWPPPSTDLNPTEHCGNVVQWGNWQHECANDKSGEIM